VQDVERAFRRKAKEFHPDLGGSTTAMAELNEARARALGDRGLTMALFKPRSHYQKTKPSAAGSSHAY
jgi:hypothetical protein